MVKKYALFLLLAAAAAVFTANVVSGFKRGIVYTKGGQVSKNESPFWFAAGLAGTIIFAAACWFFAIAILIYGESAS